MKPLYLLSTFLFFGCAAIYFEREAEDLDNNVFFSSVGQSGETEICGFFVTGELRIGAVHDSARSCEGTVTAHFDDAAVLGPNDEETWDIHSLAEGEGSARMDDFGPRILVHKGAHCFRFFVTQTDDCIETIGVCPPSKDTEAAGVLRLVSKILWVLLTAIFGLALVWRLQHFRNR